MFVVDQVEEMRIKAYEFMNRCEFFRERMDLGWTTRFIRMYDRGWIYGSMAGDEFVAMAGAYRIPSCAKEFLEELPEKEEGSILFIPFFISNAKDVKVPLKMLKEFLAVHPEIRSVAYYKKSWQSEFRSFELIKNSTETLMERMHTRAVGESRKLRIHPPEMVPLYETQDSKIFEGDLK